MGLRWTNPVIANKINFATNLVTRCIRENDGMHCFGFQIAGTIQAAAVIIKGSADTITGFVIDAKRHAMFAEGE